MPRDWLLFGAVALWTLYSLLAIFDLIPVSSAINRAAPDGKIGAIQRVLHAIPYVRRVEQSMEAHGHPTSQIAMKLQFLETSYFIMLSAYAAAVVSLTLILIVWGAEGDGYTSVLTVLGKRTLVIYWLFLPVLLIIDLFFSWLGLHGYRAFFEDSTYRADMIVTSNGSIAEIVLILSLSLLCSLAIARFTVCYLHARRHAPDIPEQLPTRSIPPQDPRPEVEYWKPEDRER